MVQTYKFICLSREGTGSFSCSIEGAGHSLHQLPARPHGSGLTLPCLLYVSKILYHPVAVGTVSFLLNPPYLQTTQWGNFLGLQLLMAGIVLFLAVEKWNISCHISIQGCHSY